MEYTTLGDTGLTVSRLCFGTWRFNRESDGTVETTREEAHDLLDACEDHGVNFIDTANSYGGGKSEEWIGEWLADRDREDYVVASKVYNTQESRFAGNLSRKNIRAEIEGTLERLDTDYLDLYYIHRWDPETPIEETLRTLTDLVREGKVHYLGASNLAGWQLTKALWTSDREGLERFDVIQPWYNAAYGDHPPAEIQVAADQDVGVCNFQPLYGGFFTGKYERDGGGEGRHTDLSSFHESDWAVLDAIRDVADEVDATPTQVAIQWCVQQDDFTCVPIFGARDRDQFAENVGALDVTLSAEQVARIDEAGAAGAVDPPA
ncbi:MAG: aldo/keto reductase [Halobacteriaceae archaeon]